jgi:hypothetical protein
LSIATDRALYKSDYKRLPLDRYFTEPAVSSALAIRMPSGVHTLWEPACGRGDMAKLFRAFKFRVLPSDIDISEWTEVGSGAREFDFLKQDMEPKYLKKIDMIVTNPPFGDAAEAFVRRALSYTDVRTCAFLLRSEWKHGKSRLDLFREQPFSFEITLTWRPRWDWWLSAEQRAAAKVAAGKNPNDPDSSPRHNFSWFVWDRANPHQPNVWAARTD